jgi:GT2 family glycosyltransferase
VFHQLGGFDAEYEVNYGDIDYCLRAYQAGHRIVYTPHAELYHFESASRPAEVAQEEIERFRTKWAFLTETDPYYNNRYLRASPPDFGFDPESSGRR